MKLSFKKRVTDNNQVNRMNVIHVKKEGTSTSFGVVRNRLYRGNIFLFQNTQPYSDPGESIVHRGNS